MAAEMIFKCRSCAYEMKVPQGVQTIKCRACGRVQTVPANDVQNEAKTRRKFQLMNEAEDLRRDARFDEAILKYDDILADFSQEADAYWGLLLARYGIEYVDDKRTGKKIPTFHRVSTDSILSDTDYLDMLEYADAKTRDTYITQAQEIENLRKAVLTESAKVDPYDIFICYKQTNGSFMTEDNERARQLYDYLTSKGYRVFLAGKSLNQKPIGDYEIYIYAALKSAQVMVAFGSQTGYYESAWVKNEWSRFLGMIANGEKKYFIPCYWNISRRDLPEEFEDYSGIDIGNDLNWKNKILENITELIGARKDRGKEPRQVSSETPQSAERMQINFAQQALVARDWNQALVCYDIILKNINARCAEAYVGKVLCEYQCVSLIELAQKLLQDFEHVQTTRTLICGNSEPANISAYDVPGYFEASSLSSLFPAAVYYDTKASRLEKERDTAAAFFVKNKNMNRALEFAEGEYRAQLLEFYQKILDTFEKSIQDTKEREEREIRQLKQQYETQKNKANEELRKQYDKATAAREEDYKKACSITEETELNTAIELFEKTGNYKESAEKKQKLLRIREKIEQIGDGSDYLFRMLMEKRPDLLKEYVKLVYNKEHAPGAKWLPFVLLILAVYILISGVEYAVMWISFLVIIAIMAIMCKAGRTDLAVKVGWIFLIPSFFYAGIAVTVVFAVAYFFATMEGSSLRWTMAGISERTKKEKRVREELAEFQKEEEASLTKFWKEEFGRESDRSFADLADTLHEQKDAVMAFMQKENEAQKKAYAEEQRKRREAEAAEREKQEQQRARTNTARTTANGYWQSPTILQPRIYIDGISPDRKANVMAVLYSAGFKQEDVDVYINRIPFYINMPSKQRALVLQQMLNNAGAVTRYAEEEIK